MHSYIGNALFHKAAGCAKLHVDHGVGTVICSAWL